MKEMLGRLKVWLDGGTPPRRRVIARSALAVLALGLCISIVMQSNIQRRYSRAADMMREQIYQGLREMSQLFARVEEPGVDVQHKLVPALSEEYAVVAALNAILVNGYGPRRGVLSSEQISRFDTAFEEYSSAYRQGLETGLARADMAAIMAEVQPMIDKHFAPKVEPTPPVLIIDGSSGTAMQD